MSNKKKKKKKKNDNVNARKVVKDGYLYIDRIWAEYGTVHVIDRDGKKVSMTIKDAAARAAQLNAMIPHVSDWHKDAWNKLIEDIIKVCREAKAQQESPANKETAALTNILAGKTAEGKEIPKMNNDEYISHLTFRFPMLSDEDIIAIMRDTKLDEAGKMNLMQQENKRRSDGFFDDFIEKQQQKPQS